MHRPAVVVAAVVAAADTKLIVSYETTVPVGGRFVVCMWYANYDEPMEHMMSQNKPFKEATPREVKQRLDTGEDLILVDVREPDEMMIAAIDGAEERPMSQVRDWMDALPKDRELVIFCHHGGRSAHATWALAQRGYTNVTNMSGGIDQWSQDVDPTVPRY